MNHDLEDIDTLEEYERTTFEDEVRELQHAINDKLWGMEGSMGRAMMGAIEQGFCILATTDTRDYWGNHIPSRTQVEQGTKGSVQYARHTQPEFWAYRSEDWADRSG